MNSPQQQSAQSSAVHVHGLSRAFRGKQAISDIHLQVPTGSVFGLVGLNGAGKTTLIRHIIGAMKPLHGTVNVLGQDPTVEPERLMARIGYMTEEDSLPKWMRVSDLIQFCRTVYPTWSDTYAAELCEMFGLSPSSKLKSLSKGGRARAALLAAIAHRPELLILDEPSSGLDPIARADILEAIIRTTVQEGRTVLFSSHLLEEIDRVCDWIALIHDGKMLETITAEELSNRYVQLLFRCDHAAAKVPALEGAFGGSVGGIGDGFECAMILDMQATDYASPPTQLNDSGNEWQLIDQSPASIHQWFAARVRLEQPGESSSTMEATSDV